MSTTTTTRGRTALRWLPLGLATLLACGGGVAVLGSTAGQDDDRAQVAALVVDREEQALAAEQEFHDTWATVLASASPISVERETADSEAGAWLLAMLSEGQDSPSRLASEHGIDETSATLLVAAFEGRSGSMESFVAVNTAHETGGRGPHSYIAAFETGGDAGVLVYTTDDESRLTAATITWDDGSPERS